jgi:hypothetical protein
VQTLLAYAWERDAPAERIQAGLSRIEQWYGRLWGDGVSAAAAAADRLGLQLWHRTDEPCRWPAWATCRSGTVATLHVPLGYQRLVGPATLDHAPVALTRRLHDHPAEVMRLTAPFVLALLDSGTATLELWTDRLGLGRLYEVRTEEGRIWSNRPVAALLFAGLRAEADPLAWRRMAACDWAMGDETPYRGVRTIPAGTHIRVDRSGHREQSLDVLGSLVGSRRDPLAEQTVADTAAGLIGVARSVRELWPEVPVLSLSGGRDSRLVVAAFVAAGVEVRLKTSDGADGEAETARELVSRLDGRVEHEVTVPTAQRPGRLRDGAYARARQWHDMTEGLRPALYLRKVAPRFLIRQRTVLVGGMGGEFGHGPGYPDDVERLERLPPGRRLEAFASAMQTRIVLPRGVARQAEADVAAQVEKVLTHAAARGVTDAKALDWFYADERLRRWGMVGESHGVVLPLLAPEFLAAAFGLNTAQSRESMLHRTLIERLVPAWSSVPFYRATLKQRSAVQQERLWEEADVDLLSGVIADSDDWGDGFDVAQVQEIWRGALAGRAAARDELLLQRVVWRAAFTDHLAAVNGEPVPKRRARTLVVSTGPERASARVVRRLAVRANDVPLARRMARTWLGRKLRRRLGV